MTSPVRPLRSESKPESRRALGLSVAVGNTQHRKEVRCRFVGPCSVLEAGIDFDSLRGRSCCGLLRFHRSDRSRSRYDLPSLAAMTARNAGIYRSYSWIRRNPSLGC